uniref:Uncharacterized protein n=1 Tax=Rhizophora mucronata TaxID=61149 RepID=A0A2P2NNJ5_RHIMU
MGRPGVSAKR